MNKVDGWRSTYRQVELAAVCYFFGKNSEEVENGCVALHIVSQSRHHQWKHVLPRLHLYRQVGEANAELDPGRLRAWSELLEEKQELASESGMIALRDL